MLDNRIYTFLELCEVMNYHKTAENLNMTQPAVTQHIKFLEEFYQCKLFDYSTRKLKKTTKCIELEKYARKIISLDLSAQEELIQKEKIQVNIGATKTIGEYILSDAISSLVLQEQCKLNFMIDNTETLLHKLNHFELDVLLLEGYVDKDKYLYHKISDEELIGICSPNHKFAYKEIPIKEVLRENILIREKGSGTRNVFEIFLLSKGYNIDHFKNQSIITSNKLIEHIVEQNFAISFVYHVIQTQNPNLAYFRIKDSKIMHEFNFVFLNSIKADRIISFIQDKL